MVVTSLGTGVIGDCDLPSTEPKSKPWQGQQILSTTELSLQHHHFLKNVYVCMCECIPHMFSYLWSPKEGIGSSGAGVASIYEQPDTKLRSSGRAVSVSNH